MQPLALTLGEPAGIGPDLALAVWHRRAELERCRRFYLVADPEFLRRRAARLGTRSSGRDRHAGVRLPRRFRRRCRLSPIDVAVTAEPGRPDGSSAPAAIASIRRAVADVLAGAAAAIVTNPVAKNVLYNSGFAEPGHTEFLATLVQEATGEMLRPVMMLWSPELAVVPVTIHLPLQRNLPASLHRARGRDRAYRRARSCRAVSALRVRGWPSPGLNPHAGENGALGEEDRAIVAPAVARLVAEGIDAKGPLPADSLFHKQARATYDAALCMYHDQALIPIKTLAFDHAVNVTLGLPFVRTSPDHGTAFDIAGTGVADPTSLIAALRLAARLATADIACRRLPRRERAAGRPAAAARSHSPAWSHRQEIARTEFSARSQSCRPHRPRGGRARRHQRCSRSAPGRADSPARCWRSAPIG